MSSTIDDHKPLGAETPMNIESSTITPERFEPLAIVGMAYRLPQEAVSDAGFWSMLLNKQNVMTEWPKDRVNIDAFFHPDASRSDTINSRGGHFLAAIPDGFDAPFFSMNPSEVEGMDPAQRVALETTYHSLENAGIPLEKVWGSKTSVYVGNSADDYRKLSTRDPLFVPPHPASGSAGSMIANRISWFFNLLGPSITIDTACSSSMVALDLACQNLRSGGTDMALVAGVNLMLDVDASIQLSGMGFVSPDSKSYSFESRANGYGRGEGVGVLAVKRLSTALRDNDTVRAVIRATGSNQDGRTLGISQPSQAAQEQLIRETYTKAGIDMATTRYVEAHGTGTEVGDPIEAAAIGNAFKHHRSVDEPMYIGAVKSNIGHLEGASGIAGIIKTVLMLERGTIIPNANFESFNPKIDAKQLKISCCIEAMPWPSCGLRRASVSSFGFGGTNSHVIIDDAFHFLRIRALNGKHCTAPSPLTENVPGDASLSIFVNPEHTGCPGNHSPTPLTRKFILVWSTKEQGAMQRLLSDFSTFAATLSVPSERLQKYIQSLSYTLCNRRSFLDWASFAVIDSIDILKASHAIASRPVRRMKGLKLGFVFTGQGAQYAGMGMELLQFTAFRHSFEKSEQYLAEQGCSWSLKGELAKCAEFSQLDLPALSQPLSTILQIGIIDLLYDLGVRPLSVVGHSSGEIAAAYAVGGLSQESACKIAYYRGICAEDLLHTQYSPCGMLAAGLAQHEFVHYEDQLRHLFGLVDVAVACINSPRNITLSGRMDQIDWLEMVFLRDSIFARKLKVGLAYHSPRMQTVAARYLELIGRLDPGDSSLHCISMVSSVTGRATAQPELSKGQYWVDNMVQPVNFSVALTASLNPSQSTSKSSRASIDELIEIGPHGALRGPIQDMFRSFGNNKIGYLPSLTRSVAADVAILKLLGTLWCKGCALNLTKINNGGDDVEITAMVLPNLPQYPFNHLRKYWHEARSSRSGYRFRKSGRIDLLGTPAADWNPEEARWRNFLRVVEQPWIADHKINGNILYPAAGMVAMALEAAKQLMDGDRMPSGYIINDMEILNALIISGDSTGREVELILRPLKNGTNVHEIGWSFRLCAVENDNERWRVICQGEVQVQFTPSNEDVPEAGQETLRRYESELRTLEDATTRCTRSMDVQEIYDSLKNLGIDYGPAFQGLRSLKSDGHGMGLGEVSVDHWLSSSRLRFVQPYIIHPTTLDAILHTSAACQLEGVQQDLPLMVPSRLGRLWISNEGINHSTSYDIIQVYASITLRTKRRTKYNLSSAASIRGNCLLSISELEATAIASNNELTEKNESDVALCSEVIWRPDIDLLSSEELSGLCETARPLRHNQRAYHEKLGLVTMKYLLDAIDRSMDDTSIARPSHLNNYISWARDCLSAVEEGSFNHISSIAWRDFKLDQALQAALVQEVQATPQGKFINRVGSRLSDILSGKIDALEFIFQGDAVQEFYEEIVRNVICYEPFGHFLELLTHKNPSLKFFEVGAGTGSFTDYTLQFLSSEATVDYMKFSRYQYTDVSPAFFQTAATRYAKYGSSIKYSVFDMTRDPTTQDLPAESFDVVIACSALHVTDDLEATMRNIRKLLRPGGKLVIMEPVQERARCSFAFGLLPGWWLGKEEHRKIRPWLLTSEWDDLLHRTGFSGIELEFPDFRDDVCHEYSIMISTVENRTLAPAAQPRRVSPISIIVGDSDLQHAVSEILVRQLSETGYECNCVVLSDLVNIDNMSHRQWISLCEINDSVIAGLNAQTFGIIKHLFTASQSILWVTSGGSSGERDPRRHVVDGLARTASTENFSLHLICLALQPDSDPASIVETICKVFQTNAQLGEYEPEYLEQNGMININRVRPASRALENDIAARKDVTRSIKQAFGMGPALKLASLSLIEDDLTFVEDIHHSEPLHAGHIEIKVSYSGINFHDYLAILGQIDDQEIGAECAGVVTRVGGGCEGFQRGDRVATIFSSYQTYARGPAEHAMHIPDNISLAEASASIVVLATAWHCLVNVARLREGESVLIHSAAGGTGQAAVQIAQYLGAEVYATVGTREKREFLKASFGIPENHIFSSRNQDFAYKVTQESGGRGVDVVLNSLSGKGLVASWECLSMFGRLVEIGKRDIYGRSDLPMYQFRKSCSFMAVDMENLVREKLSEFKEVFKTCMALLSQGTLLAPHPMRIFGISELQEALKWFQSGVNYGKAIIEMRDDDIVHARLKPSLTYRLDASSTYLIAGGLGGLGRDIAQWMVRRGAKYMILLSRSGIESPAARDLVDALSDLGVSVKAPQCDISNPRTLAKCLSDCTRTMPPIIGCVHSAMVLKDAVLPNMTFEDWEEAVRSKILGSWNLHNLLPARLSFFICLSSLAGIIGSGGQANYASGNAFQDELVRHRIAHGQRASSLDLGWFKSMGVVAESADLMASVTQIKGLPSISTTELHALLEYCCDPRIRSSSQILAGLRLPRELVVDSDAREKVPWLSKRTFRHVVQAALHTGKGEEARSDSANYTALFQEAGTAGDAVQVVLVSLQHRLSAALGVAQEDLDLSKPLNAYGVDSLLAVELRNYLVRTFDSDVAVFDIVGAKSIEKAGELVVINSKLRTNK